MPKDAERPLGVSPSEVLANSGGEQFFLFSTSNAPAVVGVSWAQLPDGTQFAGDAAYAGNPAFTNNATNYIWYDLATGVLANNDLGWTGQGSHVPLWEVDVDVGGNITATRDRRPWFGGSGGGGASSSVEKLKEILQHSVMEDATYDALLTDDNVDVTVNVSTGTFTGESQYELEPGEVMYSSFTVAGADHLPLIDQPFVVVLPDRIIDPVSDIQIYVSRVSGGPPSYPSASDWTLAPANYSLVDLGGQNGTNCFNVRIENTSAFTYNVVGWGVYSNPVTAPGGVIVPKTGLHVGGTGLDVYNTNPAAFKTSAVNFGFTWDDTTDTLSWASPGGTADDLVFEFSDDLLGTVQRNLTNPGSLAGIVAGSYVYFDIDRNDAPNTAVTLQVSAGAPVLVRDRFILGKRVADPDAVNDVFVLWNNHVLGSVAANAQRTGLQSPPPMLSRNVVDALFAANTPSGANPYLTAASGGGVKGFSAASVGVFSPTIFSVGTVSNYLIFITTAGGPSSDGYASSLALVSTSGLASIAGTGSDGNGIIQTLVFSGGLVLGAPNTAATQIGFTFSGGLNLAKVTVTSLSTTSIGLQSQNGTPPAIVIGF